MKRFELLDGERTVISESIHWKNRLLPAAGVLLSLTLLALRLRFMDTSVLNAASGMDIIDRRFQAVLSTLEALCLLAMCFSSAIRLIRVSYTRYYVTTQRIISVSGILAVDYQEMLLSRCETVYLRQSVYERLFRSGDILCVSAGATLYLDDVHDAVAFKQTLMKLTSNTYKD